MCSHSHARPPIHFLYLRSFAQIYLPKCHFIPAIVFFFQEVQKVKKRVIKVIFEFEEQIKEIKDTIAGLLQAAYFIMAN